MEFDRDLIVCLAAVLVSCTYSVANISMFFSPFGGGPQNCSAKLRTSFRTRKSFKDFNRVLTFWEPNLSASPYVLTLAPPLSEGRSRKASAKVGTFLSPAKFLLPFNTYLTLLGRFRGISGIFRGRSSHFGPRDHATPRALPAEP